MLDQISMFGSSKQIQSRRTGKRTNPKPSEAGLDLRGGRAERVSFRHGDEVDVTEANDTKLLPMRSSIKERKGNALASGADEGRDKLR